MKKLIAILASTGLILAVAFITPVYAFDRGEGGGPGMHEGKGKIMDRVMDEIGLTTDQQAEIKALHEGRRAEGKDIQAKMKQTRMKLKRELDKETPNTQAINKLTTEITNLYGQKVESRVQGVLEMKKVLTREQYETLQEKMKIRKEIRSTKKESKKERRF